MCNMEEQRFVTLSYPHMEEQRFVTLSYPHVLTCIKTKKVKEFRRILQSWPKCEVCRPNVHGETLLMIALLNDSDECALAWFDFITFKLGECREVDCRETRGRQSTALHIAAKKGKFQIVCKLIAWEASPSIEDGMGLKPADVARNNGHFDIEGFLRGKWLCDDWSPITHKYCPFNFQREVYHCMHSNVFRLLSRDVKFLIFNALLSLHKVNFPNFLFRLIVGG